jgi:hypothetical protein
MSSTQSRRRFLRLCGIAGAEGTFGAARAAAIMAAPAVSSALLELLA